MSKKKEYFLFLIVAISVLLFNEANADNDRVLPEINLLLLNNVTPHPDGKKKCLDDGGQIILERSTTGGKIFVCEMEQCHDYDDGELCEMHRCDLDRYYKGTCEETIAPSPLFLTDNTVASYFHQKVVEILSNVSNTGYAHNKGGNFSLIPDYTELATPHTDYNLFLDCSGFVGYYVLQGLASDLYSTAAPSQYYCEDRPLAADFADIISSAPQVTSTTPAATMDDVMNGKDLCWGQVEHVRNIRHGDVIVYKHPNHIGAKNKPCGNRLIYNTSGNTGHILFAHATPIHSTHCKDNLLSCGDYSKYFPGTWQYVVEVADSTTSRHMDDSRKVNTQNDDGTWVDQSDYNGNKYHAWTAGKDGVVERCDDGTYHRHCIMQGSTPVEAIKINTRYSNHPTGIGVGKMYISPDRKSFRTSYTAQNTSYDEKIIFIGRPIVCPAAP